MKIEHECGEDFPCEGCEAPTCDSCAKACGNGASHRLCADCADKDECPECDDVKSERETRNYEMCVRR